MSALKSKFKLLIRVMLMLGIVAASGGCGVASRKPENLETTLRKQIVKEQLARGTSDEATVPASSYAHYYFLLGELSLADENYEDALSYFEKSAALESAPAQTLRKRLIQLYVKSGRLEDALGQVELIGESVGDDLELIQLKAGLLSALDRVDAAADAYRLILSKVKGPAEDIHILLASLYSENERYQEAIEVLEDLLRRRPKSLLGHYYLARMFEIASQYDKAKKKYEESMTLSPESEAIRLDFARFLGSRGEFARAVEITDQVLEQVPDNLPAQQLRSQLLLHQDKLDEALEQLEELDRLDTGSTNTRLRIALIKLERGNFDGAIADLNIILAKEATNDTARYYLASAYAGRASINDAIKVLNAIAESSEVFVRARTFEAYLLQQDGRSDEAARALARALPKAAGDIRLLQFLAALYRESGEVPQAIKIVQQIIELEPENDWFYFILGTYFDELNDKQHMIDSMEKAIELNPRNASALNYLGYTLAEKGVRLDEAKEYIERALEVEPENGYYIDSLGWIYYQLGDYKKALEVLTKAAELARDDAVILEHLAAAQKKNSQLKSALKTCTDALVVAPDSDDKEVEGRLHKLCDQIRTRLNSESRQ